MLMRNVLNFLGNKLNFKANWPYFMLIVAFAINLFCFYGRFTNIVIDIGREFYFPQSILNGEVLYKDIFNIFGPYSYLFNALLFKLFGIKFSVLYIAAIINSFLIIYLIYEIARKFVSNQIAFAISFFSIVVCCHSCLFMDYWLPYCFAIVYGLSFTLLALLLMLGYIEKPSDKLKMYFSFFFVGCAIANKYEFLLLPFILFGFLIFYKLISKRDFFLNLFLCALPNLFLFGILFWQGLALEDIVTYYKYLSSYSASPYLHNLYIEAGSFFSKFNVLFCSVFVFVWSTILFALKIDKKIIKFLSYIICAVFIIYLFVVDMLEYIFAPIVVSNCVLFLIYAKKLLKNRLLMFFVLITIFVSLKCFWLCPFVAHYGVYFIHLNLILFFCLFNNYFLIGFDARKIFEKSFSVLLIVLSILFFSKFCVMSLRLNHKLSDAMFYLPKAEFAISSVILDFMRNEVGKDESVIILPEGLIYNFLTGTKSDNYYNIFTPDRVQSYGEDNIIEHYKKTRPDYFILLNTSYDGYGVSILGKDFGLKVIDYIKTDYELVKLNIAGKNSVSIYKKM